MYFTNAGWLLPAILASLSSTYGCPQECACYVSYTTEVYDCENVKLTSVPLLQTNASAVLKRIILLLNGNSITELPQNTFGTVLLRLSTVSLARNGLSVVHTNFAGIARNSIEFLHLGYNRLSEDEGFMSSLNGFNVLRELDLSANHFQRLNLSVNILASLESLIARDNNLTGIGEFDLAALVKLERLNLANNHINFIHPLAFKSFRSTIRKLDLSSNSLNESSLLSFVGLTLSELYLQNNNIGNLSYEVLSSLLSTLQIIDISNNLLRDFSSESLRICQHLTRLSLRNVSLQNTGLPVDSSLRSTLVFLDLGGNFLTEVPAGLELMDSLMELCLSNNLIADTPRSWRNASAMKSLQVFDISFNQLQWIPKLFVQTHPNLVNISLSHNQIRYVLDQTFAFCANAIDIDLSHNDIEFIGINAFSNLQPMVKIDLSYNRIITIYYDILIPYPPSLTFWFTNNPFVCDCYAYWLRELRGDIRPPDCVQPRGPDNYTLWNALTGSSVDCQENNASTVQDTTLNVSPTLLSEQTYTSNRSLSVTTEASSNPVSMPQFSFGKTLIAVTSPVAKGTTSSASGFTSNISTALPSASMYATAASRDHNENIPNPYSFSTAVGWNLPAALWCIFLSLLLQWMDI